jgi:YNFM family putative membrane transporter
MAASAAVVGRLSVHLPVQRIILGLLLGSLLVMIAIFVANAWWQLLALRTLLGLLLGGLPPLAYAAAADLVSPNRRGAVVGIASSAGLLGWAVSPALVGFLVAIDPQAVFGTNLLLVAGCAVALAIANGRFGWHELPAVARALLARPAR